MSRCEAYYACSFETTICELRHVSAYNKIRWIPPLPQLRLLGWSTSFGAVSSYIKSIIESTGTIDEDIIGLDHEINALISIHDSPNEVHKAKMTRTHGGSLADKSRVESLWQNVGKLLKDCRKTQEELEKLMSGFLCKRPSTSRLGDRIGGKIDNIKKTIRMEKKDEEFKSLRVELVNYQISLQVLLTALSL